MTELAPLAGERQAGETSKAIQALNDYLRMGSGRSMQKLCDRYQTNAETSPTKRLATLKEWSVAYGWQERAESYDAQTEAVKNQRRSELLEAGLALDYERISELTEIYAKLKAEFADKGLWYTDIKLSAKGDTVEVDVFNKALIDCLRGALDDVAKETGGRKQKTEVTGKDGEPLNAIAYIEVVRTNDDRGSGAVEADDH